MSIASQVGLKPKQESIASQVGLTPKPDSVASQVGLTPSSQSIATQTGLNNNMSPSTGYVPSSSRVSRSRSTSSSSQKTTTTPTPAPEPVKYEETKTDKGTELKGEFKGDLSYRQNEDFLNYQSRISQTVQSQAKKEAERIGQERGEQVSVTLSYTPSFLPKDEERKVISPGINFFGVRPALSETVVKDASPKFNFFSSETATSKPIGMISAAPESKGLDKASTFLSKKMGEVERGETNVPGVVVGLAQVGVGFTKEAVNVGTVLIRPRQTVKAIGQGVKEVVKDPVGAFDSVTYQFGQNLQYNTGETVGRVGFHIALSRGVGEVSKLARAKIDSAVASAKMGRGYTQATWRVDQPAIALTKKEALAQTPGLQTTLGTYKKSTFKGGLISDKQLSGLAPDDIAIGLKTPRTTPTAQKIVYLDDIKNIAKQTEVQKTLLGTKISDKALQGADTRIATIPKDYYTKTATQTGKGTNLRLDDSVSYINYETVTVSQTGKKVFSMGDVAAGGKETLVSTGIKTVGTKPSGLNQPKIRAVDKITGKEYNIPAEFLERRLIEQPSLSVVGQAPRQLFSADPIGGLVLIGQDAFKLSPKFSTSSQSATPILKPVISKQPSKIVLNPVFSVAGVKSNQELVSVQERDKLKKEKEQITYTFTPVIKTKIVSDDIGNNIYEGVVEDSATSSIISPRSMSASRTINIVATKPDTASETITVTTPITQNVIKTQKTTVQRSVPNPRLIFPSPRLSTPQRSSSNQGLGGFVLFVRRSGVFSPSGVFSSSREAFIRGKDVVGGEASASFKIKDARGNLVTPFGLGERFRLSKKDPGVVVERRKYRISSPGEKQEITYKGLMTLKAKRKGGSRGFF